MDRVRWGIIGCGDVTERKSGPAFQLAKDSELVSVMRRDAAKVEDYARRKGVPKFGTDADALINDPEVDAVYVATPPGSHLDYAMRVLAAGKPCYVEKPMARNYAECVAMTEAFEKAGIALFVAYYRRGLARFLKAKEIVETGGIGTVTSILYRLSSPAHSGFPRGGTTPLPWRLEAEEAGGGLFLDLGCHTLDIIDYIVGELQGVSGEAGNAASGYAVEDGVSLSFRTKGGAVGTGLWSFASSFSEELIEIRGTQGRVMLSTFSNEPVVLETPKGRETFDLPNPDAIQQPLIQSIVDELLGRGKCPSTGRTAMRTSKVIDQALKGYYSGRDDDFWNRPESWRG